MTNQEIDILLQKIHPRLYLKHPTTGDLVLRRLDMLSIRMVDSDEKLRQLIPIDVDGDLEVTKKWIYNFNEWYICDVMGYKSKADKKWVKDNLKSIRSYIVVYTEGDIIDPDNAIRNAVNYLKEQKQLREQYFNAGHNIG